MNDGIDIGDLQEGYQVGKSVALREWSFRKEQREFKKLIERLYARKWWRDVKAEGGERYQRKLAQLRKQNENPKRRKKLNAQQQVRRLAAFVARGVLVTCGAEGCGATWSKLYTVGQQPRYCSPTCARRAYRSRHREELNAKKRDYDARRKQSATTRE